MSLRLATLAIFTAALPAAFAQAPPGPIRSQSPRASSASPGESRPGVRSEHQSAVQNTAQNKDQRSVESKPVAPQRQTIAGAWKLNHADSDDARQKFRAAYRERAQERDQQRDPWGGQGGPYGNGPYGRNPPGRGDPWPGGGGGWGGNPNDPHGNRGNSDAPSEDDLEGLEEFIFPAESVTFVLDEPQIVLTDDDGRRRVFFTDGRKVQKSKNDDYRESKARWEGNRLLTEEKNPQGGNLERAFELAGDGRHLFESVYVDDTNARSEVVLRFVYDIAPGKP